MSRGRERVSHLAYRAEACLLAETMKLWLGIALLVWLICGLAGAWRLGELHWKPIAKGPITLAKAFDDNPVTYPGPG